MVESRPLQNILTHGTLILSIAVVTFPIYIALVASTHAANDVMDDISDWNINMATAILALLPPIVVVVVMQYQFVKGLIETEK